VSGEGWLRRAISLIFSTYTACQGIFIQIRMIGVKLDENNVVEIQALTS